MQIVLSGLPGKVASVVAENIPANLLHTSAISSARNAGKKWQDSTGNKNINLVDSTQLAATLKPDQDYVALDFTPGAGAVEHLALWNELHIPAVIGSSGYDTAALRAGIQSQQLIVLCANLAMPVVALQAALRIAAEQFTGAFAGLEWSCVESHQAMKKDVSGTARALLPSFAALGFSGASVENIKSVRDPAEQRKMGVPQAHIDGHGWHHYQARGEGIELVLEHNINGRTIYAAGALKACRFALDQWKAGVRGKCYDMIDVIKA